MAAVVDYDPRYNRLRVEFPYSDYARQRIKLIPGNKFVPADKGGPAWTVPATLKNGTRLRNIFGKDLRLTPRCVEWGKATKESEERVRSVAGKADAELHKIPSIAPALAAKAERRVYQRADIMHGVHASVLNTNEPGMGKTLETIGSIIESGLHKKPVLVLCPRTSIRSTWQVEINEYLGHRKETRILAATTEARADAKRIARRLRNEGKPFWFVTTFSDLRLDAAWFQGIEWGAIVIDEFHTAGMNNRKTKFFEAINKLRAERKFALSGTPMKGKERNLWGPLHWIDSAQFSSFWTWAAEWLDVEDNYLGHKMVSGIRAGKEEEFFNFHSPYLIRRTKAEEAKDLPPVQVVPVWCEMSPAQAKQYKKFNDEAELEIEDESISAINILAIYTRLKQFANSKCEIRTTKNNRPNLYPTGDSGKIEQLIAHLAEWGIDKDWDGTNKAIVSSQFSTMCRVLNEELTRHGIPCTMITGDQDDEARDKARKTFQGEGGPAVIILSTMAGGVSLTLTRATSVHLMDETWVPDDQEQVINRCHRVNKPQNVTAYYYRTRATVDEYIYSVTTNKDYRNKTVLDLIRQGALDPKALLHA